MFRYVSATCSLTPGLLGSSDEMTKMKWLEKQLKKEAEMTNVWLPNSFSQLLAYPAPEDSSGQCFRRAHDIGSKWKLVTGAFVHGTPRSRSSELKGHFNEIKIHSLPRMVGLWVAFILSILSG